MKFFRLTLCILLAWTLSGCVFIAGGAVLASAAYVAHDHRTLMQERHDQLLQQQIVAKLNDNKSINQPNTYVYVTVFYDQVLLTGQVPNQETKDLASDIVKNTADVNIVYNQLTLAGPSSSLTRLSDSWISTKVKMHLMMVKDLKTSEISVTVNNGVVYLMGHNLNQKQAGWAANAARKADGVQKVVVCRP